MRTDSGRVSALYECTVMHGRLEPVAHRFAYRVFYLLVDLDELGALHRRLALLSVNRANLLSFRERDFLPTGEAMHNAGPGPAVPAGGGAGSLKERVLAFCAAHGGRPGPGARVLLLTLPRILGYQFNPVSFYFCVDAAGRPVGAVAEVTNTFREVKPYFVPPDPGRGPGAFRVRVPKDFYVSPFSSVEDEFDFILRIPGQAVSVRVDDYAAGRLALQSTLAGGRTPLSDRRIAWFLLKYPFLTLRVIALIHWQAVLLRLRGTPFFPKAGKPARQRGLYRPHRSLEGRPVP